MVWYIERLVKDLDRLYKYVENKKKNYQVLIKKIQTLLIIKIKGKAKQKKKKKNVTKLKEIKPNNLSKPIWPSHTSV